MKNIAERHITDYANTKNVDFAQLLGLPEITAEDLFRKFVEKEAIVIDAVREQYTRSTRIEGWPWPLSRV